MANDSDVLFGKIAMQLGLLTKEQIDTAVALQEMEPSPRPLGTILVEKKYLSEADLQKILSQQKANLASVEPVTQKKKEDILFGKVAVREGLATPDEVNEVLREQAKLEAAGQYKQLGQMMVERGTLTEAQVQRILERQKRRIMVCRGCKARYNVPQIDEGKPVKCPRCGGDVVLPTETGATGNVQVDGSFDANATQVLPPMPAAPPKPAAPAAPAVPAPSAPSRTPTVLGMPVVSAPAPAPGVPTARQVQQSRRPTVVMRSPLAAGPMPPASPAPQGGAPAKTPTGPVPAVPKTPSAPLPGVKPAAGKAPTAVPPPKPGPTTKTPTSVARIAPAAANVSGIMKVPASAGGRKVDAKCPICDNEFNSDVDPTTGRVKCPQCKTSFSPR